MFECDLYLKRLGLDVVYNTTERIRDYLESDKCSESEFFDIITLIANSIKKWTNFGYVGYKKEELEEEIFQEFWDTLRDFVLFCARDDAKESEREFAESIICTGNIYRLIGNSSLREDKEFELEYSELYVSWDKIEFNQSVYDCLCEPVFWIAAEIKWPEFGFDIKKFDRWYNKKFGDALQIAKDEEDEVVFPTIKENVLEIKKIKSAEIFERREEE